MDSPAISKPVPLFYGIAGCTVHHRETIGLEAFGLLSDLGWNTACIMGTDKKMQTAGSGRKSDENGRMF